MPVPTEGVGWAPTSSFNFEAAAGPASPLQALRHKRGDPSTPPTADGPTSRVASVLQRSNVAELLKKTAATAAAAEELRRPTSAGCTSAAQVTWPLPPPWPLPAPGASPSRGEGGEDMAAGTSEALAAARAEREAAQAAEAEAAEADRVAQRDAQRLKQEEAEAERELGRLRCVCRSVARTPDQQSSGTCSKPRNSPLWAPPLLAQGAGGAGSRDDDAGRPSAAPR